MSTVTGVAGSAINAVCAVSNNGVQIANGESAATAQSIVNDLATIAGKGQTRFVQHPWVVAVAAGGQLVAIGGIVFVEKDKSAVVSLDLPHGVTMSAISLRIAPATHVSLPQHQPSISLNIYDANGGGGSSQGTQDAQATVGAYNAVHTITLTLSPHVTIDRTVSVYTLSFTQESGTNHDDGYIVQPAVTLV